MMRMNRGLGSILMLAWLLLAGHWATAANYPGITYEPQTEVWPGVHYQVAREPTQPWAFCILSIDLSNPCVELTPGYVDGRVITSAQAKSMEAVAAVNAGLFSMATGVSMNHIEVDNRIKTNNSYNLTTLGLTGNHHDECLILQVNSQGQPVVANPAWGRVINALGGMSNLVTNGAVNVTYEGGGWENDRHPRTGAGYDKDNHRLYLVTVDGRQAGWSVGMNLTEFAKLFIDLGCEYAMNYDGGGSTTCWVDGEVKNRPSDGTERTVNSIWAVMPAAVIDNTDSECSATGAWAAQTSAQNYDRNYLRLANGSPSDSVAWSITLPKDGTYKVYAWYPATAGSTMAAHYQIDHLLGSDTVVINQTASGDQWVSLGAYAFTTDTAAQVRLTNPLDSAKPVAADAVKFVYTTAGIGNEVIDNQDARTSRVGNWSAGSYGNPWESDYLYAFTGDGSVSFSWEYVAPVSGEYQVEAYWVSRSNREKQARYEIEQAGQTDVCLMDQSANGEQWNPLNSTRYRLGKGEVIRVTLNNNQTTGAVVIADAIRFTLVSVEPEPSTDAKLHCYDLH